MFRHFTQDGVDPFEVRRRVGNVTVVDLDVLDLTDPAVRRHLNLEEADLEGDTYTTTQRLGALAAAAGFGGILAPSAALPHRKTLVVFAAGIPHLTPGPSRIRQPHPASPTSSPSSAPTPTFPPLSATPSASWLTPAAKPSATSDDPAKPPPPRHHPHTPESRWAARACPQRLDGRA